MLDRLNPQASNAIILAQEESRRLGHNFVGTEQILLGLIAERAAPAARALASCGIVLKNARKAVENNIGVGSGFVAKEIPFTPRAQRVMKQAESIAVNFGEGNIGAEHILLGLIREGEGVAARVITGFGVDLQALENRLVQVLNGEDVSELSIPPIPLPDEDEDDDEIASESRVEALYALYGTEHFIKAEDVSESMLGWLPEDIEVFGVYINASDDYVVVCDDEMFWYDGEAQTHIKYSSITVVELPQRDDDPYLRLVLRNDKVLMLPVLNTTEDNSDLLVMFEFLWHTINSPRGMIKIEDIESREDFIAFLRQPGVNNVGFESLAQWLQQGSPSAVWLRNLKIEPESLDNANLWRLLAAMLLRHPGSVISA